MSKKNRRRVTCEALEDRTMFVTYQVTGTNGADAISISIDEANNKIISAVNGVSASASDLVNNKIQIDGLGGNDTISITETGANEVVVNAGTGNDTINIGIGANNLDATFWDIEVNGDGNTDTVVLFDQNNTSYHSLVVSGTLLRFSDVPTLTANVENVVMNCPTAIDHSVVMLALPSFDMTINGGGTQFEDLSMSGDSSMSGSFVPDAAVAEKASIDLAGRKINVTQVDSVKFSQVGAVTMTTPNANDIATLGGSGGTHVNGSSGGVAWCEMIALSSTFLTLDFAAHDAGAGNDTITGSGMQSGTTLFINAGTGTNVLNCTGGTWNVSSAVGVGGVNLDVVTSGFATITFVGSQTLHRLQIEGNSTIKLNGGTTSLTTQQLTAANGAGTLDLASGTSVTVSSGLGHTFAIDDGESLIKKGLGTLTVNAPQSHGAVSVFENRVGNTTFNTDAGSSTSRTLILNATSGTVDLNATQHLARVAADGGYVSMTPNGNRVLVMNSVATGSEAGTINLNNNDMIVDYGTAAQSAAAVRALITSGYSNGSWAGLGINSKTAELNPIGNTGLGTLEGTQWIDTYGTNVKFDGQPVDNTCMLIKYTYCGDVDFNGSVDASDYNLVDFGFVNHLSTWGFGDVDGNGSVDASDYNLIDFAFSTQGAVL